jgi:ABC-type glutathione transport system ATPase component
MTEVIRVDALTYTYPKATEPAVRGMDFTVGRGEIFGVLGPSGAGKSTTPRRSSSAYCAATAAVRRCEARTRWTGDPTTTSASAASHPEMRTANRRDSLRRSSHFNPRRTLAAEDV